MRKLNPPQNRTRVVRVTRPVVDLPGYQGLYRVEDVERREVEDDWIKPGRYFVGPIDPVTGQRVTIEFCMKGRPVEYFRAKRREGDWEFIKPERGRI